jgi:diguanylate cyclase (GGDEF)-like protein
MTSLEQFISHKESVPSGPPVRLLRRRYVVALSIIALLIIVSQIALQSLIADKIRDPDTVEITRWVSIAFLIVTLIVLALEAFLVFAPASKRMKNDSKKLIEREQDLHRMFDASPTALLMVDMNSLMILRANQKAMELTGLDTSNLLQRTLKDLLYDGYKTNRTFFDKLQSHVTLDEFEITMLNASENVVESLVSSRIVQYDSRLVYVLGFTSMNELRDAQQNHEYYATYDELTGLVNRRTGMTFLEKAMARSWRESNPVSIIYANLDALKIANSTYGQAEGDQLIRAAANIMTGLVRSSDFAVRFGDEDFLLILPSCPSLNARRIVENLERLLKSIKGESSRKAVYTIKCGVATFAEDKHNSPDELIAEAKQEMQQGQQTSKYH